MPVNEVVDLLLQLSRALLAEFDVGELTSAQWIALRYFSRANSSSRTLSALAAYQATTTGTASQTIKCLEQAGLLGRDESARDGRSSVFTLTHEGRRLVENDPLNHLVREVGTMSSATVVELRDTLRFLLQSVSGQQPRHAFGTCNDCAFLLTRQTRMQRGESATQTLCRVMNSQVEASDLTLLCKSFRCLTAKPVQ